MSELPRSWTKIALADVGTWRGGGTPSKAKAEFWTNGNIPWVSPKDMKVSKLDTAQDLITEAAVDESATNLIAEGSVLIVTRSGILSHSLPVAVNTVPVALNQDIKAVTPHGITDASYLRLTFECYEREILNGCRKGGTTVHSIEFPSLLAFLIPLPPLAEQKRIVAKIEELFSELDAGEESLRRARRQLGVYRQSLLKQAFEGKLTASWRAQHPELLESPDQLLARIQAERQGRYQQQLKEWEEACNQIEKIGNSVKKPTKPKLITPPQKQPDSTCIPNEWTWVDLGLLKQFSLYGPRFSSDDYSEDGVCVLRTSDIGESGKVNLHTAPRLRLNAVELHQYGCQKGDILITRTGSLGTLAVFNDDVDSIPGAYLIQYRLVAAHYAPFLYHFLRGPVGQSALTGGGAGVGRPNLNAPTIEAIPIPLCSLPEQQEIVRMLDEQFEVIEQNEREIDAALKRSEALRQSILKRAFTGQLVPQDPADEPAAELLASVRAAREEIKPVPKKKRASHT
ncbi:MAG: restriction endonuclease subunit S [Verrucomicrobiales bacterium]|nr:restriction endonuclease subunit S [Verrucomicrobiales bacterium]